MRNDEYEGFEFLESDIVLFNMLVQRQHDGDDILSLFNIQLIDEEYQNRDALDVNNIYVIRGDTNYNTDNLTYSTDSFKTTVYIVINISQYDIIKAQALLKSAVKCINQYIEFEALSYYTHIKKIQPRYTPDGQLHEYTIELECIELDEKEFYSDLSRDLKLYLKVNAKVEGEEEYRQVFPRTKIKTEKLPILKYKENEEFAGG